MCAGGGHDVRRDAAGAVESAKRCVGYFSSGRLFCVICRCSLHLVLTSHTPLSPVFHPLFLRTFFCLIFVLLLYYSVPVVLLLCLGFPVFAVAANLLLQLLGRAEFSFNIVHEWLICTA